MVRLVCVHSDLQEIVLTVDSEVDPCPIVPRARISVGKNNFAFVPSSIAFSNGRQVYGGLAVTWQGIVQQVNSTDVRFRGSYHSVVPIEDYLCLEYS